MAKDRPQYAFPHRFVKQKGEEGEEYFTHGMTLRDYFAGQAMVGVFGTGHSNLIGPVVGAMLCYEVADAMLKAREEVSDE